MSVNMQSTKHAKWTTRLWRILAALDEAISVSPMEHLEKRIAALEQEVSAGSESAAHSQGIEARPKRQRERSFLRCAARCVREAWWPARWSEG